VKKYGDIEKLEVLHGEEANVLNQHMRHVGKFQVSNFSDEEKEALQSDLQRVRDESSAQKTGSGTDKPADTRKRRAKSSEQDPEATA
jgi:hypothetical protein